MQGYVQISTTGNVCGIHSDASYPTVDGSAPPAPPGPASTPTPPAPTPSGGGHYNAPPCQDDELQGDVVDGSGTVIGSTCAPECDQMGSCPSDVPEGAAAVPFCALQDQDTGKQYCALTCFLDSGCPSAASCAMLGPFGVCVYPEMNGIVTKLSPIVDTTV